MKKIRNILLSIIAVFLIFICFPNDVKAESYLYLNSLFFDIKINEDASINVTEYWNIDIEETNTLYKSFKTDNTKYTAITDVKVTDITHDKNQSFLQQNNWEYHVDYGKYYGTNNEDGDFEIGWGVGLDNDYENREYKIEYKVQNAVTKYNDYAELYWQLLGKDFSINSDEIKGTITLPANANSKEDIKVWGHIETLNGTIYATDLNKIEFEVDGYRFNTMLEIRTLFPTEMITTADRTKNIEILQTVIEEETKWAEEANRKREAHKNQITAVVTIVGIILDIIFIIIIIKAQKNPIKNQKRFLPEQELEYYRDIPRKNATPGEAVQLIQKNISKTLNYDSLGKVFSAVLLNLKLKGYLDFEIDENKKEKEQISLVIKNAQNAEELLTEEKEIYQFLEKLTEKKQENVLTLKELQKAIKSNPEKIQNLGEEIGKEIHSELISKGLLDKKQAEAQSNAKGIIVLQIVFLVMFLLFAFIFVLEEGIGFNNIIKSTIISASVLGIISIIKEIQILRKINAFTQKGVNEIEEWKGLKKYMEDFSLLNEREVPEIIIWERFLVYATAFGIADKAIEQLKIVYPDFEKLTGSDYTYMYIMMNTNFNSTFSQAVSTSISSTYSSGSGSGGGFSGGGGGGRWPVEAVADAK